MLKKRIGIIGLIFIMTMIAGVAGCKRHATPEEKLDRIITYLTDDLELTDTQNEILDRFKVDMKKRIVRIQSQKNQAKEEVMTQLKSDQMDQEKIMEAISDVRSEIGEMIPMIVANVAEFHKALSDEQRAKLVDQIEDLQKLHCGR